MDWYNNNWRYRKKITIDNTKVNANLTNFPVYLDLANLGSDFFANVKSDGGDIRITTSDGLTEVPVEVVAINTGTSTGEVHFKAPGLSSSSATEFYVYYGNSGASLPTANSTYGSQNVWDSNYYAVYHLTSLNDSTSKGNNLTNSNASAFASGKLGGAYDFNGSNSFLSNGSPTLPTGNAQYTLEAIIYPDTTGNRGIIGYGNYGTNGQVNAFRTANSDSYNNYWWGNDLERSVTSFTGQWQQAVARWDGSTRSVKKNGGGGGTDSPGSHNFGSGNFRIACTNNNEFFDGRIDEVRISNIARADTWLSTQWNNHNSPSTFYSVGTQQSGTSIETVLGIEHANIKKISGLVIASVKSINGLE